MIVTITGVPGSGKTLWSLVWVKAKAEKENRPVFYSGIKDLSLPWTELDPEKWMEVPPNSIVVIDECQRVFRPRMHGSVVPKYVAELETHRHLGIDLVFITQHPLLIDTNVRRLCGLHFHVVRKWGMQSATVHEWPTIKENCDKSRDDSVRHEFRYPKAAFAYYKSAEVHTYKARVPYHVWIIAAVPFVVGYAGWRIYHNWFPSAKAGEVSGIVTKASPAGGSQAAQAAKTGPLTTEQFLEAHQPRVIGLAHTAPIYDEVTRPREAPYPAACVHSAAKGCHCYTQQGTKLDVPLGLCQSIVSGGFFVAWDTQRGRPGSAGVVQALPVASEPRGEPARIVSLGNSRNGNITPAAVPKSTLEK